MRKRTIWLGGLVTLLLFGLFFIPARAQKAKNVNLRAIFRDAAGDKIRSDGKGIYTHGVDSVECYISPRGELKFIVKSPKRRAVVDLGEDQRALDPFNPYDPTTYPTDYYSGPLGIFEFVTPWYYENFPINLLQMAPNTTAWGGAYFRCFPVGYNRGVQILRFYYPGQGQDGLYNPNAIGCVVFVTANDPNGDGQIDSWDFEPIPNLGENGVVSNTAWVWRLDNNIYSYFGWLKIPFRLTVQRLN